MPARADYDFFDYTPAPAAFLQDAIEGLSAHPKALPPKYFYDEAGSTLFDAICELPEYYLTRTELGILRAAAAERSACVGPDSAVVEYGSGSGSKTALLIEAVQRLYGRRLLASPGTGDFMRQNGRGREVEMAIMPQGAER